MGHSKEVAYGKHILYSGAPAGGTGVMLYIQWGHLPNAEYSTGPGTGAGKFFLHVKDFVFHNPPITSYAKKNDSRSRGADFGMWGGLLFQSLSFEVYPRQ
jgi:hypothetical protein